MENALCREHDPELFFPTGRMGSPGVRRREVDAARRVCAECPLASQRECAGIALDTDATVGVWAGVDFGDTSGTRTAARKALSLIAGREFKRPSRVPARCQGPCGRPLRPQTTKVADAPGTVVSTGHGLCSCCRSLLAGGDIRPAGWKVPA